HHHQQHHPQNMESLYHQSALQRDKIHIDHKMVSSPSQHLHLHLSLLSSDLIYHELLPMAYTYNESNSYIKNDPSDSLWLISSAEEYHYDLMSISMSIMHDEYHSS